MGVTIGTWNRSKLPVICVHVFFQDDRGHNLAVERLEAILAKRPAILVEASWNVMAHAQEPDFVFRRNWRVRLNRRGRQFSRLLAARGVRISGSNAGYTMFRNSAEVYWLPTPFACFPFTSPPVHHRVSSNFNRILRGLNHDSLPSLQASSGIVQSL